MRERERERESSLGNRDGDQKKMGDWGEAVIVSLSERKFFEKEPAVFNLLGIEVYKEQI